MVAEKIRMILSDPKYNEDSNDDFIADAINELAKEFGWHIVDSELINILLDTKCGSQWYNAIVCLFGTECHNRGLPCDKTYLTALLLDCLRLGPHLGVSDMDGYIVENLVWGIAYSLHGVGDMSQYDPTTDPMVLRHTIAR